MSSLPDDSRTIRPTAPGIITRLSKDLPLHPHGLYRTDIMETRLKAPHSKLRVDFYDTDSDVAAEARFVGITATRSSWFPGLQKLADTYERKDRYTEKIIEGTEWFALWQELEVEMYEVRSYNVQEHMDKCSEKYNKTYPMMKAWFESVNTEAATVPRPHLSFLPDYLKTYAEEWVRATILRDIVAILLDETNAARVEDFARGLGRDFTIHHHWFGDFDKSKDTDKLYIKAVFEHWNGEYEKNNFKSVRKCFEWTGALSQ